MGKKNRDTYKYKLMDGNKILDIGITNDPQRRESEHKTARHRGRMKIFGIVVTEESAKKWEKEELEKYKRNHSGKLPKYNKRIG